MALPPPLPSGYQLWYYYPSVPANAVIAVLFTLVTLSHLFGIVRDSTKRFCIPLVIGGIFEIVGYCFRIQAHYKVTTSIPYAVQSVLILLAPILFAASVYMYLGRIIKGVRGEAYAIIKPKNLTKIFVTSDVICFGIQAIGGGMLASAKKESVTNLGNRIVLAGLILQIVIFLFFNVVAFVFHKRFVAASMGHETPLPWMKLLYSLYCISFLIALRNVIRAVEYAMSSNGPLLKHEWTIFVFDGGCMILVLLISLLWYTTDVGTKLIRTFSQKEMESRTARV